MVPLAGTHSRRYDAVITSFSIYCFVKKPTNRPTILSALAVERTLSHQRGNSFFAASKKLNAC
jgi:hypothetical protein